MTSAVLDTSVVLSDAADLDRPATISVVTLGELRAGVVLARTAEARAQRQTRLSAVRAAFEPLSVDERVAESYGEALATARSNGRITKATDLLIIATAAATGRALWTLDRGQAALATAVGVVAHGDAH